MQRIINNYLLNIISNYLSYQRQLIIILFFLKENNIEFQTNSLINQRTFNEYLQGTIFVKLLFKELNNLIKKFIKKNY